MISLKTPDGKLNLRGIIPPIVILLVIVYAFTWPSRNEMIVISGNRILPFMILAMSWSIFSGPTRYVSLATAAFFGIGIYVAAYSAGAFSLLVLAFLGGAVSFVIAVIIGIITLRLRGVYFTIFTFGLIELLRNLLRFIELRTGGAVGRRIPTEPQMTVFMYLLGLLVILVIVAYVIKNSRFGKALVSIGESEEAAAHVGVNTTVVKVVMFAISAFFIGAAGAIIATRRMYVDPDVAFDMSYSFLPVLMVIFGGSRNLAGPVVGAFVFTYIQNTLVTRRPEIYMIAIGAIMVLAILFLPEGILGLGSNVFDKLAARIKRLHAAGVRRLRWVEWDFKLLGLPGYFITTLAGTVCLAVLVMVNWLRIGAGYSYSLIGLLRIMDHLNWLGGSPEGFAVVSSFLYLFLVLLAASLALLVVSLVLYKTEKRAAFSYCGFSLAALTSAMYLVALTNATASFADTGPTVFPYLTLVIAVVGLAFLVKRPESVHDHGQPGIEEDGRRAG